MFALCPHALHRFQKRIYFKAFRQHPFFTEIILFDCLTNLGANLNSTRLEISLIVFPDVLFAAFPFVLNIFHLFDQMNEALSFL